MNYHRLNRPVYFCMLLVVTLAAESRAQLPSSAFTSPSAEVIDPFVQAQVKTLAGAPVGWSAARAVLIQEGSHANPAQGFYGFYAGALNTHLLPLATDKDVRIRLNAGIVAARIAAKAGTDDLAPVATALLKDSSEAVVLWGMQTAKYVILAQLSAGKTKEADAMAKLVVEAAKAHATNSATVEEAYRALLLNPILPQSGAAFIKALPPAAVTGFAANVMAFYKFRIDLYNNGLDAPAQPVADTWCTNFMVNGAVWGGKNADQQAEMLHLMLSLAKGASKQNATSASPDLLNVIKLTGQAFEVACRNDKRPGIAPIMAAAHTVAVLTPTDQQAAIDAAIGNLDTAVMSVFP